MVSSWILFVLFSRFDTTCSVLRELTNVDFEPTGKTAGVAISDLDNDGTFEVIVAVTDGPNKIIKFDRVTKRYYDISSMHTKYHTSRDETGKGISVCTCDIDGDGTEELYIHNHNDVYPVSADVPIVPDKLFKMVNGVHVDLFSRSEKERNIAVKHGGYSVACIDRNGRGKYDVIATTYSEDGRGVYKVISAHQHADEGNKSAIALTEISEGIGMNIERDGRGILVGPIFSNKYSSDIFITNDNSFLIGSRVYRHDGSNVLFKNQGDGTFKDVAADLDIADTDNNCRGAGFVDLNNDDKMDLVYTNWLGPTRAFQILDDNDITEFKEVEESSFTYPAASDVLLLNDLDNDCEVDILKTGANGDNEVFTPITVANSSRISFRSTILGDEEKLKRLHIRGIAVADLNGDGNLEVFISHDRYKNKTFSIYQNNINDSNWIRVMPLTKFGAPARGSVVTLTLSGSFKRRIVIGGDCSFMCQSEPVAHFGVGNRIVKEIEIFWPDGHKFRHFLNKRDNRKTLVVTYSGKVRYINQETVSESYVSGASLKQWNFGIWGLSLLYLYLL